MEIMSLSFVAHFLAVILIINCEGFRFIMYLELRVAINILILVNAASGCKTVEDIWHNFTHK